MDDILKPAPGWTIGESTDWDGCERPDQSTGSVNWISPQTEALYWPGLVQRFERFQGHKHHVFGAGDGG